MLTFSDIAIIAARQGGFIVPYVWEIVDRKNLTNFEGCHFARFYILIWWSFPKIETKNFNSGSCFFKLVKLGTIPPAAHFLNCVHIGRSQTIAAIICGLSSGKHFVNLREVFKIFKLQTLEEAIKRCSAKQILKAYLCFYSFCLTLVFYRLEKVFYTSETVLLFFLHESRIKLISNQFD